MQVLRRVRLERLSVSQSGDEMTDRAVEASLIPGLQIEASGFGCLAQELQRVAFEKDAGAAADQLQPVRYGGSETRRDEASAQHHRRALDRLLAGSWQPSRRLSRVPCAGCGRQPRPAGQATIAARRAGGRTPRRSSGAVPSPWQGAVHGRADALRVRQEARTVHDGVALPNGADAPFAQPAGDGTKMRREPAVFMHHQANATGDLLRPGPPPRQASGQAVSGIGRRCRARRQVAPWRHAHRARS